MRRWDLAGLLINSLIGASIFGLPSTIFGLLGSYSIFALLACSVCAFVLVICFAEVASRYSGTGGPYLYARDSFGSTVGFVVGWLAWVARLTSFAANSNLLLDYLALPFPGLSFGRSRLLFLAFVCISLSILNLMGIRIVTDASNLLAVLKLIPLLLFAAVGLFFIEPAHFSFAQWPGLHPFSQSLLLLIYMFTGFEMAVIPAGEMRRPQRDLPVMLFATLAFVVVISIAIQVVSIGTFPELASSSRPLADAAGHFLGRSGIVLMTVALVISLIGNLNVSLLSASRMLFALGQSGDLPSWLGCVNDRSRTPTFAILATATVLTALCISGTFLYLLTLSSLARLATYLTTCAALPVLRRDSHIAKARFRLPAGFMISGAGAAICVWLFSSTSVRAARDTLVASLIGLSLFILNKRLQPKRGVNT